jgi:Calmodulin-binding
MPLVIQTPSMQRRHDELESRLAEIESAVKIFSKKVYIQR